MWCTLRVLLYCLRGESYCTCSYISGCINIRIHATACLGVLISFYTCKPLVSILVQVGTRIECHARYVKHGTAYGLHKVCINKIHLTSVTHPRPPAVRPTSIKNYFSFLYRMPPIVRPTTHSTRHISYDTQH